MKKLIIILTILFTTHNVLAMFTAHNILTPQTCWYKDRVNKFLDGKTGELESALKLIHIEDEDNIDSIYKELGKTLSKINNETQYSIVYYDWFIQISCNKGVTIHPVSPEERHPDLNADSNICSFLTGNKSYLYGSAKKRSLLAELKKSGLPYSAIIQILSNLHQQRLSNPSLETLETQYENWNIQIHYGDKYEIQKIQPIANDVTEHTTKVQEIQPVATA